MAANDINISDLTFDGIRNSLIDYLKTQDTLKDYNFEGSAIKTLIDLLAYNTFYYGYYANMIANEMFLDTAKLQSSLISLTKPLGYVVPSFVSSKISLRLNNINLPVSAQLAPFSTFRGTDASGKPYFFYNIVPVPIQSITNSAGQVTGYRTLQFDAYEGKSSVFRQLVSVDTQNQTFRLNGADIDPRTITVEVRYAGTTGYSRWDSYYLNPETVITSNTEIFFPERTNTGFRVNFGKYSSSDTTSISTGRLIAQGDEVYISYLVSSGAAANNISNIVFVSDSLNTPLRRSNTNLQRFSVSFGGISEVNPDEVRFFAPKTFARQNRLVTKNDYSAIMDELGYKGLSGNPDFKFKIFGGEDATPPSYGRVFVSILGINPTSQLNEINQVISTLKSKSVVSILPEYLPPVQVKMFLDISCRISNPTTLRKNQAAAAIRAALRNNYLTPKYNRDINKLEILQTVRNSFSGIQIFPEDIKLIFRVTVSEIGQELGSVGRRVSIKNKIKQPTGTNATVNVYATSGFSPTATVAKNSPSTGKFLYIYDNSGQRTPTIIGEIDYENGSVIIYPQVTSNSLTFWFELFDDTFAAKDQLVCYLPTIDSQDAIIRVT